MRRPILILAAAAALVIPGGATADDAASPSLTFALSTASAVYGQQVAVTGSAGPGMAGAEIVVDLNSDAGPVELARTVSDPLGNFSVPFVAQRGGDITVLVPTAAVASAPQPLQVAPAVHVRVRRGAAFSGAWVVAHLQPATYSGTVEATVSRDGTVVGRAHGRARNGRVVLKTPTPGVGRFELALLFAASDGLAARSVTARTVAVGRALSVGASGPDVAGLTRRLAELHFRVPGVSSTFSYALLDSVYAFQKAYGLPRTGVVSSQTWRKLMSAQLLRPRYRGPAAHIEVDKTRQILLDVRNGTVDAIIPVSTGATGNTPEGTHHIRWKALATTTWLGPAILYRTLDFFANSFAIHGYPSVPPYPASHGCVRIPIWTADWLYQRSPVGETVYVYH